MEKTSDAGDIAKIMIGEQEMIEGGEGSKIIMEEAIPKPRKAKKTVSFAAINQFFVIEYQEPTVAEGDPDSLANDEIENMILGDGTSSSNVCFDGLDKISAGTAFDTTTFSALPRRLSGSCVGQAGFPMDDVIQRLLDFQASIATLSVAIQPPQKVDGIFKIDTSIYENDAADDSTRNSPKDSTPLLFESPDYHNQKTILDSIPSTNANSSNTNSSGNLDKIGSDIKCSLTVTTSPGTPGVTNFISQPFFTEQNNNCETRLESTRRITDSHSPIHEVVHDFVPNVKGGSPCPPCGVRNLGPGSCDLKDFKDLKRSSVDLDTAPITLNSSPKDNPLFNFKLGQIDIGPLVQPTQLFLLSPGEFRRRERFNRQKCVSSDMSKGIEKYSKCKLFFTTVLLWFVLPAVTCSIVYGVIPYCDTVSSSSGSGSDGHYSISTTSNHCSGVGLWDATLIPWILIMSTVAALSLEIYSSVISGIEFNENPYEKSPSICFWCAFFSISASMAMQCAIFLLSKTGQTRNWLAEMSTGFLVILIILSRIFYLSQKSSISNISTVSTVSTAKESGKTFRHFLFGLFLLILGSCVGYSCFAIAYAQFSTTANDIVGYILAFIFPFLRLFVIRLVESGPYLKWGSQRGQLCAGTIVTILASLWHGVYGCLVIATSPLSGQYCIQALVESVIQGAIILEILSLPSSHTLKNPDEELLRPITSGIKYKYTSRSHSARSPLGLEIEMQTHTHTQNHTQNYTQNHTQNHTQNYAQNYAQKYSQNFTPNSWRSKSSIAVDMSSRSTGRLLNGSDSPQGSVNDDDKNNEKNENLKNEKNGNSRNENRNNENRNNENRKNESRKKDRSPSSFIGTRLYTKLSKITKISNISMNGKIQFFPCMNFLYYLKKKRLRTSDDDTRETQLSSFLGITWITGTFTPLAFLTCSAVISLGYNKKLFTSELIKIENEITGMLMDGAVYTHPERVWSLNIFNDQGHISHFVYVLIGISLLHIILMVAGTGLLCNSGLSLCKNENSNLNSNLNSDSININEGDVLGQMELARTDSEERTTNLQNLQKNEINLQKNDVWGLITGLIRFHYNIIALSTVATLALIFSIVFPWYGMNISF